MGGGLTLDSTITEHQHRIIGPVSPDWLVWSKLKDLDRRRPPPIINMSSSLTAHSGSGVHVLRLRNHSSVNCATAVAENSTVD